jgi:hypothetical protein
VAEARDAASCATLDFLNWRMRQPHAKCRTYPCPPLPEDSPRRAPRP